MCCTTVADGGEQEGARLSNNNPPQPSGDKTIDAWRARYPMPQEGEQTMPKSTFLYRCQGAPVVAHDLWMARAADGDATVVVC